jgi:hypothetical protein
MAAGQSEIDELGSGVPIRSKDEESHRVVLQFRVVLGALPLGIAVDRGEVGARMLQPR